MGDELRIWAIVEVMGHNEYAGFITAETIAGAPMLRVDVPPLPGRDGFTKFLSLSSIYAISPCTEETARLRAQRLRRAPFEIWSVERQVVAKLREEGKLLEDRQLVHASADEDDEDVDFGDDESGDDR